MEEQFMEVLKPLLAMKLIVTDQRNRCELPLQTIAKKWWLLVVGRIKEEFNGLICLKHIASVLSSFIGEDTGARQE